MVRPGVSCCRDHTAGNPELVARLPSLAVYGNQVDKIAKLTHPLNDGDTFEVEPAFSARCLLPHIC